MSTLERIRKHPARYLAPWAMTVARPVLGGLGLQEAKRGNWKKANRDLVVAMGTDFEGTPARFLHATSKAGAVADPIADGILRAEGLMAYGPEMNRLALALIFTAEVDNLRLNATIQSGHEQPIIPRGAKWGSAIEAAGGVAFGAGLERDEAALRFAGQLTILAGAVMRNVTYRRTRDVLESPTDQRVVRTWDDLTPEEIAAFSKIHVAELEVNPKSELWNLMGMEHIVLYTTGHKSGQERKVALPIWRDANGAPIVVASFQGEPDDPHWLRNLQASEGTVTRFLAQDGEHETVPQILTGRKRKPVWRRLSYDRSWYRDEYQEKTEREIPLVRLADL